MWNLKYIKRIDVKTQWIKKLKNVLTYLRHCILQTKLIEGRWFFKCQNGFNECLKNKWQICSIQVLLYKVPVLARYLVCYMNSTDEIRSGYQVRIIFTSTIHNMILIW